LHTAQLMPLPLTVSCFSKIQIGVAFLVLAHPGSPGQRPVKRVCVCVLLLTAMTSNQQMQQGLQTVILSCSISLATPLSTATNVRMRPASSNAVTTPTTTSPTSKHCTETCRAGSHQQSIQLHYPTTVAEDRLWTAVWNISSSST